MKRKVFVISLAVFLVVAAGIPLASRLHHDRGNPRDRMHAYYVETSVEVSASAGEVYRFLLYDIPSVYEDLTEMHDHFAILEGDHLEVGGVVECVEGDPQQYVVHNYVVTALEKDRLVAMASTPSRVVDRTSGRQITTCDTWVYLEIDPIEAMNEEAALLSMTVVIAMENSYIKTLLDIIALIGGTRDQWETQFTEELENYKKAIEGTV